MTYGTLLNMKILCGVDVAETLLETALNMCLSKVDDFINDAFVPSWRDREVLHGYSSLQGCRSQRQKRLSTNVTSPLVNFTGLLKIGPL